MFGIELDKLIFVGVLIGLIVGPSRLVEWRRKLPQMVGRVHALYQQGRAQVTRDLDDMAPDWREYDPRQLHPRRILRELGADVRRAAESDGERVERDSPTGESRVEPTAQARNEQNPREAASGVGDDVEDAADAGRQEESLGDLDERRNAPGDDQDRPGMSRQERRQEAAERKEEQHVQTEIHLPPVGGGEEAEREAEDQVRIPVEMGGRQEDDREEHEVDRRGDDPEPTDGPDGPTVSGVMRDGKHATP